MIKHLNSVEEVISELGGARAVAELTDAKAKNVVPMWKNRNKFPATTHARLQAALRLRGAEAPDELWGMR